MDEAPTDAELVAILESIRIVYFLVGLAEEVGELNSETELQASLCAHHREIRAAEAVWWSLPSRHEEPHPLAIVGTADGKEQVLALSAQLDAAQKQCLNELRARQSAAEASSSAATKHSGQNPLAELAEKWRREDEQEIAEAMRAAFERILAPPWPQHIRDRYPRLAEVQPWTVARALLDLDVPLASIEGRDDDARTVAGHEPYFNVLAAMHGLLLARNEIIDHYRVMRARKPAERRPSSEDLCQRLGPDVGRIAHAVWEALPVLEFLVRADETLSDEQIAEARVHGNVLGQLATAEGTEFLRQECRKMAQASARKHQLSAENTEELEQTILQHLCRPCTRLGYDPSRSAHPIRFVRRCAANEKIGALRKLLAIETSRWEFRRRVEELRNAHPSLSKEEAETRVKEEIRQQNHERLRRTSAQQAHRDESGATLTAGQIMGRLAAERIDVAKTVVTTAIRKVAKSRQVDPPLVKVGKSKAFRVPKGWYPEIRDVVESRSKKKLKKWKSDEESPEELSAHEAATELKCSATKLIALAEEALGERGRHFREDTDKLILEEWEDLLRADFKAEGQPDVYGK